MITIETLNFDRLQNKRITTFHKTLKAKENVEKVVNTDAHYQLFWSDILDCVAAKPSKPSLICTQKETTASKTNARNSYNNLDFQKNRPWRYLNRTKQLQRVAENLYVRTYLIFSQCYPNREVYPAPFNMQILLNSTFPTRNNPIHLLRPDITVMSDIKKLDKKSNAMSIPDLVMEILPPTDSQQKFKQKFEMYQNIGVKEYWAVMADKKVIWVYSLNKMGKYIANMPYTENDNVESIAFPNLKISLRDIFK